MTLLIDIDNSLHCLVTIEGVIYDYDLILMVPNRYQVFDLHFIFNGSSILNPFDRLAPSISHLVLAKLRVGDDHITTKFVKIQHFSMIYQTTIG